MTTQEERRNHRTRFDRAVDQLLAEDPAGVDHAAEQLANHNASLVRRINQAFADAGLAIEAYVSRPLGRAVYFRAPTEGSLDRLVCRVEDVSKIVMTNERNR